MRVAREHDNRLYFVATHLIIKNIISAFFAELDKSMTTHHYKLFPLCVVPMFTFSDARFGDVYAHLSAIQRVNQFRERAPIVNIHLQIKDCFFLRQITQECAVQTLGKGISRNFWNHQCLWHIGKLVKQVHNMAKCRFMSYRTIAISAV